MISKPASLVCESGVPVVLRSVTARGRLSGLLLTMTLRQVFRNNEVQHIEATYTFPLPWGAVLTGLQATLGDRQMRGKVTARRQAVQQYEEAVEQGDAPVMVEMNRDGSFTASLGSLKPGEEATVELSYGGRGIDIAAMAITVGGLAALVVQRRRGPVPMVPLGSR